MTTWGKDYRKGWSVGFMGEIKWGAAGGGQLNDQAQAGRIVSSGITKRAIIHILFIFHGSGSSDISKWYYLVSDVQVFCFLHHSFPHTVP